MTRAKVKTHGERWHLMHCGGLRHLPKRRRQSMRSDKIASYDKVDVEVVRKTLRAYREKMWG